MELTGITAVVGAVTGTMSLVWNIFVQINSAPKLFVEGDVGHHIELDKNLRPTAGKYWLTVRVTNIGRRPISLVSIHLIHGKHKLSWRDFLGIPKKSPRPDHLVEQGMPISLSENQMHQGASNFEILRMDDFFRIEAHTSDGRIYSNSISNMRFLKERIVDMKAFALRKDNLK